MTWTHYSLMEDDFGSASGAQRVCTSYAPDCIAVQCADSNPGYCSIIGSRVDDGNGEWPQVIGFTWYERYCGKYCGTKCRPTEISLAAVSISNIIPTTFVNAGTHLFCVFKRVYACIAFVIIVILFYFL